MVKNVQNASPRGIISYCLTNLWPLKFRNAKMLQHHACDLPRLHGVQSRNLTIQFPWSPTSAASQVNKRIWDSVILPKNYGKTHGWKLKKMCFIVFQVWNLFKTLGIHSNLSYLAGLHTIYLKGQRSLQIHTKKKQGRRCFLDQGIHL